MLHTVTPAVVIWWHTNMDINTLSLYDVLTDEHYINADIHPIAHWTVSGQYHTGTYIYSNAICKYYKCVYMYTCTYIVDLL